ncbi:hypothetical protein [Cognatishimia sp. F0-27]|uniref:hypothetical protein n=1 Tax=Cognatishimia sp. F0-27 TaxID=2816855 RepID=UPI001D0C33DA|nr:hypothetical protein [Cognatishimia sp. F0-27]MCC1492630.1 hypothetical protein [Cognatishimia sp. F0-27]
MNTMLKTLSVAACIGLSSATIAGADVSEHFIIHKLDQPPQEAATLVRDFIAMSDDWSLNGEFDMMGGAAVGMKICFNAMRGYVAAAGLHNLAMMPCGNLALYEEDGVSYLSMLDVGYLTVLSPHPEMEAGVALARPAYAAMLSEVLGVE